MNLSLLLTYNGFTKALTVTYQHTVRIVCECVSGTKILSQPVLAQEFALCLLCLCLPSDVCVHWEGPCVKRICRPGASPN